MKVDCRITENYLREKYRMTKGCSIHCSKCLIGLGNDKLCCGCSLAEQKYPTEVIAAVQVWSDEHPKETRMEHLLTMIPRVEIDDNTQVPSFCIKKLNGSIKCIDNCKACWNEQYAKNEF